MVFWPALRDAKTSAASMYLSVFQEAGRVFLELRGQNVIPPEAFS